MFSFACGLEGDPYQCYTARWTGCAPFVPENGNRWLRVRQIGRGHRILPLLLLPAVRQGFAGAKNTVLKGLPDFLPDTSAALVP